MSRAEFERLGWLVFEHEAARATGFSRNHIRKLVACEVLRLVKPRGTGQGKLLKTQLAQLLGLDVSAEAGRFRDKEPLLMTFKGVRAWTGYSEATLTKVVRAGGLRRVALPGGEHALRFRKTEVAELIGLGKWV